MLRQLLFDIFEIPPSRHVNFIDHLGTIAATCAQLCRVICYLVFQCAPSLQEV